MGDLVPKYHDAETLVSDWFCTYAARAVQQQHGKPLGVAGFLAALDAMRADLETYSGTLATKRSDQPAETREAQAYKDRAFVAELTARVDALERMIRDIQSQPQKERKRQLEALHDRFVKHRGLEVLGKRLGPAVPAAPPDWQAVRGQLKRASSESVVLNLDEAFERGKFAATEHAEYPIHDISGTVGGRWLTAFAELRTDLDTVETREIMRRLSEKLADRRFALGPRTQETGQALNALWFERRNKEGYATVTIQQLAEILRYQSGPDGYDSDALAQIRECVDTLKHAHLSALGLVAAQSRTAGAMYEFTYHDLAGGAGESLSKTWLALTFRPGAVLTGVIESDTRLFMAFDPELNRLNPKNERGPLLLGKYLERVFRLNWYEGRGVVTRRVRVLLVDGMGLTGGEIARPSIEKLNALSDALDLLEQLGIVKHWQGDEHWQSVDDALEPRDGRQPRMKRGLWDVALESIVTIEAGQKYEQHYRDLGLTYQGKKALPHLSNPLVQDLLAHIAETGRARGAIAGELGITPSHLSRVLAGKRRITPELATRITTLIQQGKTLPLDFNGKRP